MTGGIVNSCDAIDFLTIIFFYDPAVIIKLLARVSYSSILISYAY